MWQSKASRICRHKWAIAAGAAATSITPCYWTLGGEDEKGALPFMSGKETTGSISVNVDSGSRSDMELLGACREKDQAYCVQNGMTASTTSRKDTRRKLTSWQALEGRIHLQDYPLSILPRIQLCECESIPVSPNPSLSTPTTAASSTNPSSSIQRRATIRRLNEASTPMQDFYRRYKVSWRHPLGEGAFGKVYPATHRGTRELVALKKIPKKDTDTNSFQNEMDALLQIRSNGGHPYICSLRENFEDSQHYYLILDLVSGGEMFDHLIRMGAYSEADAARLVSEVANALTFLHGMGVVHGDLKPENLMLSTDRSEDAVIQLVDFGCAQVAQEESAADGGDNGGVERGDNQVVSERRWSGGNTPAYCPPEVLEKKRDPLTPSVDVWSLGVIMFIMLTGLHPFDLKANATDAEIEHCIKTRQAPPLRNSPITAHLSPSAIDVIEKCLQWDSKDRITASELLEHPWVRGETAREDKMQDSVKRLSMFRVFKSKLEAKVFADFFSWSDDGDSVARKASLMERAFHTFDSTNKGFLTKNDLNRTLSSGRNEKNMFADKPDDTTKGNADGGNTDNPLSLSGFSDLLAENMKNRYFPRGHVVYNEGDIGNHMYFINAGVIEVTTKDGSTAIRKQGDFFGEGALLHPQKIRSATIQCKTPVHAIEVSRLYFDKYLKSSGSNLSLSLKEKDNTRKRNRAKTILRLQKNLKTVEAQEGDSIFKCGEDAHALYILESGRVDVLVREKKVFSTKPGDIFGEHSMIMGRPRNTSAVCASKHCVMQEMKARDFYEIYNSSSSVRSSLRELCYRREFQKSLVKKTQKEFPSVADLREAFDATDTKHTGTLTIEAVGELLRSFDPSLSEEEIQDVAKSLDLNNSGFVTFEEFKTIFGMDHARATSM